MSDFMHFQGYIKVSQQVCDDMLSLLNENDEEHTLPDWFIESEGIGDWQEFYDNFGEVGTDFQVSYDSERGVMLYDAPSGEGEPGKFCDLLSVVLEHNGVNGEFVLNATYDVESDDTDVIRRTEFTVSGNGYTSVSFGNDDVEDYDIMQPK